MTGYGSSTVKLKDASLKIEIKSINSKNADIIFGMSDVFMPIETDIRKLVLSELKRGRIYVNIKWISFSPSFVSFPNKKQLQNVYKKVKNLDVPFDEKYFMSQYILRNTDTYAGDITKYKKEILKGVKTAINKLNKMRITEGKFLKKDILARLEKIEKTVNKIDKKSKMSAKEKIRKLKKELNKVFPDKSAEWGTGLVYLADKLDITEEVIRLKSHIKHFKNKLKEDEVGKSLSFMTQELLRETNTIASKSADSSITIMSVSIKEEIEKIREQVQNIL